MSIFSLFQQRSLSPAWTFSPRGKIWKVLFADGRTLVGEARDVEAKQASFFCVETETGAAVWENLSFPEPWWVGVDAIHRGVLFFHEFAKPDLPEHKRIRAVDLHTGKILWTNDDASFFFAYANFVYAEKKMFEKRVAVKMELLTGLEVEEIGDPDELMTLRRLAGEELHDDSSVMYPELLEEAAERARADLIRPHLRAAQWRSLESVEMPGYLIASYHFPFERDATGRSLYSNNLIILEKKNGRKIFADVLNAETRAVVPDSFFVRNQTVFYVKEYSTLVAVPLPLS